MHDRHNQFSVLYLGILLSTVLVFAGCSSTEPIQDRVVEHRYQNASFTPEAVDEEVTPGLKISVEPVDAGFLNEETYRAAMRDGGYETEYVNMLRTRQRETEGLSGSERRKLERYIDATEQVQDLLSEGAFEDPDLIRVLLHRLWNGSDSGNDGSEVERLTDSRFLATHNPYYQNGRYLSVFRLKIENTGNGIASLSRNNLQIQSGSELISPLSMEHFEEVLDRPSTKLDNALRMNMPDALNLPPGANIEKYLAIPAFDTSVDELSVHYMEEEDFDRFEFKVAASSEHREYQLNGYRVSPYIQARGGRNYDIVYAINHTDGTPMPLMKDIFFIEEKYSGDKVDICGIAVGARSNHLIGCATDISLSLIHKGDFELEMGRFYNSED